MSQRSLTAHIFGLGAWLAICFTAAAIGAAASVQAAPFYQALVRPEWAPPASIFGPVWTVLYALMAISAWWVWRSAPWATTRRPLAVFMLQLGVNALWSWLFFAWHRGGLALVDICVLVILIVVTIALFWRIQRWAALMLLPYLAWVAFATALNAAIWRLNPGVLG